MRPTLRTPAASRRSFGVGAAVVGVAVAMPLSVVQAHAADITDTQVITNLARSVLDTGLSLGSGGGGGGSCPTTGISYGVNSITDPNPAPGQYLAAGHPYAVSITVTNTSSSTCWPMSNLYLTPLTDGYYPSETPGSVNNHSYWNDNRSAGSSWVGDTRIAPTSSSGGGGQGSTMTFSFNLLPDGDLEPGVGVDESKVYENYWLPFGLVNEVAGTPAACVFNCNAALNCPPTSATCTTNPSHPQQPNWTAPAFNAPLGIFHAQWDGINHDTAAVPVVIPSGGRTSVTLAFRNDVGAPWLTESTVASTAVRLGAFGSDLTYGRSSGFCDRTTWVTCSEPSYVTQQATPCSFTIAAPPATCTGSLPNEPNYSSFSFFLNANNEPLGTYQECFWPRADVPGKFNPLGAKMGSMRPNLDQSEGYCLTIEVA